MPDREGDDEMRVSSCVFRIGDVEEFTAYAA